MKNSPDTSMNHLDDRQLRDMILATSKGMGSTYLHGQDNAIIGTGFAQLALEGEIDGKLRVLVETALKRQLLPLLIERFDPGYQNRRKELLTKMLSVINRTN